MSENNGKNLEISNELKTGTGGIKNTLPETTKPLDFSTLIERIKHLHEKVDILKATINKPKDQLILQANENDLIDVANRYLITVESIRNFEQFISCFSKDVRLLNTDIPKYKWDIENGGHSEIFKHVGENLLPKGYSCEIEQRFLKVPVYDSKVYFGRVDGVVCIPNCQPCSSISLVSFDISRNIEDFNESKSVVELIGMTIRSQQPVLHIRTDMNTFTFMICQVQDQGNTIFKYTTESYCECKTIIENWIEYTKDFFYHFKSEENRFHIKRIYYNIDIFLEQNKPQYAALSPIEKKTKTLCYYGLTKSELTKLNELEESFLTAESSKNLKLVSETNRSGPVYKLEHGNKLLVVKISHAFSTDSYGNLIIDELKNEEYIYKWLEDVTDGPWPKLFYSGYIFDMNYYAIVTEFIEGRCPNREDDDDFKRCFESLKKLHELDIIHGDARPPNFIIEAKSQKAYILDFGFSFIVGERKKKMGIERDVWKMKSSDGFNIKD